MAGKDKGGREARKPKAAHNQKAKGQSTPAPSPQVTAINQAGKPKK